MSGVGKQDMTEAGRAWMDGTLSGTRYFALVRREAYGPSWWLRLRGWWNSRRR